MSVRRGMGWAGRRESRGRQGISRTTSGRVEKGAAPSGPVAARGALRAERRDRAATIMGSPLSMTRSLRSSKNVDTRTDIDSLGVILYPRVSGTLPIQASTLGQLFEHVFTKGYPHGTDLLGSDANDANDANDDQDAIRAGEARPRDVRSSRDGLSHAEHPRQWQ